LTAEDARKEAKKLLGAIASGEDPSENRFEDRKAMTVRELCEDYLSATDRGLILGKKGKPKKLSTLVSDRGRIERHIIPLLGSRRVRDLTTPDVNRFMRDVASGKTAADVKTGPRGRAIVEGGAGTASRTVGLLGGILSYAVSEGIVSQNPARGVKRPADNKRHIRLSADQYRALGKALREAENEGVAWQVATAIRLLALTGCRLGEIQNLRWSDVDLPGQALRLSDSKTGESVRPLGHPAVKVLMADAPSKEGFVFPSARTDHAPYSLPKSFARVVAMAKNDDGSNLIGDLTPHGLRHAFASVAADLGYSEITIAALLGHSSVSITGRYIHHLDATLIAAANQVAATISNQMEG
jgi:integrase